MSPDFAALRSKIDDLENRSRRNNLVIYGLKETDEETPASLRKQVIDDVFSSKMGVKVACVERIHRVGTKKQIAKRPVILRLYDYNVKNKTFQTCA